jgi:hypothetical protein
MLFHFSDVELARLKEKDIGDWWQISKQKNFENVLAFPHLSLLAKYVFTLPHANADSERIFSTVSDVKTKKRNRLSHEVLNSICIIRSYLQSKELDCKIFECNADMMRDMKYDVFYDHKH